MESPPLKRFIDDNEPIQAKRKALQQSPIAADFDIIPPVPDLSTS